MLSGCLIIGLWCLEKTDSSLKTWLQVGMQKKKTYALLVLILYTLIDINLCKAFHANHALTGSDFTAFFSQKGKILPLKKLEKDVQAQMVFGHLGELDDN